MRVVWVEAVGLDKMVAAPTQAATGTTNQIKLDKPKKRKRLTIWGLQRWRGDNWTKL